MADDKDKIRVSGWFLTVNTNKQPTDELYDKLTDALDVFNESVPDLLEYMKKGEGKERYIDHEGEIKREVGEEKHRLHAHMYLEVQHRTIVHLPYRTLGKWFAEQMGLDNCYFQSELADTRQKEWILNYLRK